MHLQKNVKDSFASFYIHLLLANLTGHAIDGLNVQLGLILSSPSDHAVMSHDEY